MKTNSAPRLTIIGSSNTDLVLKCGRLPAPGETIAGGAFQRHSGGKGANQAVGAARAGARVHFVGAHGADDFGRAAKRSLKGEGIDVRAFRELPGAASGVALIFVGTGGENVIGVARSANDLLAPEQVRAARSQIHGSAAVLAQLEVPLAAVMAAAELADEAHVPFILNPAPFRRLPKSLLRRVHAIVPNEGEAAQLTGEREPEAAAKLLLASGCKHVVVTLGRRGALLCDADGTDYLKAPRVAARDAVGAGDCFTAWLAVGIAEGLTLRDAAARAVRAASISVTRDGAQPGMPWRREVVD